jgi:hypothetical protein
MWRLPEIASRKTEGRSHEARIELEKTSICNQTVAIDAMIDSGLTVKIPDSAPA